MARPAASVHNGKGMAQASGPVIRKARTSPRGEVSNGHDRSAARYGEQSMRQIIAMHKARREEKKI
jgi:hypothetical protein